MMAEAFFPELKEDDDEKIRKWLISQLKIKSDDTNFDLNIMIDKAISWLEKQRTSYTKKDVDDAYLKGVCDTKQELEKQGGQKSATWSKEDENHVISLLERLEGLCRNEFERTRFAINEDQDWLKSLKDRVIPQPKQEWSEEDETSVIPKHSYFEHIYHCGSEPMWKIGDVLAVYEFYSDHEGEYVYGKITDVKMGEDEDWLYTFDNGEVLYENMLISDEVYKKN